MEPIRDAGEKAAHGRGETTGIVIEQLPSALYRVRLDGNRQLVAHAGGALERNFVRVLVGDRVRVEISSADPGRGRIVGRF